MLSSLAAATVAGDKLMLVSPIPSLISAAACLSLPSNASAAVKKAASCPAADARGVTGAVPLGLVAVGVGVAGVMSLSDGGLGVFDGFGVLTGPSEPLDGGERLPARRHPCGRVALVREHRSDEAANLRVVLRQHDERV